MNDADLELCSFYFSRLCDSRPLTQNKGTSFGFQILSTFIDLLYAAVRYGSGATSLQQHKLLRPWTEDVPFWGFELVLVLPDQKVRNPGAASPLGASRTILIDFVVSRSLTPVHGILTTAIDRLFLFQCVFLRFREARTL